MPSSTLRGAFRCCLSVVFTALLATAAAANSAAPLQVAGPTSAGSAAAAAAAGGSALYVGAAQSFTVGNKRPALAANLTLLPQVASQEFNITVRVLGMSGKLRIEPALYDVCRAPGIGTCWVLFELWVGGWGVAHRPHYPCRADCAQHCSCLSSVTRRERMGGLACLLAKCGALTSVHERTHCCGQASFGVEYEATETIFFEPTGGAENGQVGVGWGSLNSKWKLGLDDPAKSSLFFRAWSRSVLHSDCLPLSLMRPDRVYSSNPDCIPTQSPAVSLYLDLCPFVSGKFDLFTSVICTPATLSACNWHCRGCSNLRRNLTRLLPACGLGPLMWALRAHPRTCIFSHTLARLSVRQVLPAASMSS